MKISCNILKMKSRVPSDCGLASSGHLGEPWRWSWLASQWDHLLQSEGSFGFSLAVLSSSLSEELRVMAKLILPH